MLVRDYTNQELENMVIDRKCLNYRMDKFQIKNDNYGKRFGIIFSTKKCKENTIHQFNFCESYTITEFFNKLKEFANSRKF